MSWKTRSLRQTLSIINLNLRTKPDDHCAAAGAMPSDCADCCATSRRASNIACMSRPSTTYRAAVSVALAAACMLVWLSLGVGIIGRDGDPANRMYFGVLAVGVIGAAIGRFRPIAMARALFATALAQATVAAIALVARLGDPWSGPLELSLLNGFFVALFIGSAWLFRRAAHNRSEPGAGVKSSSARGPS